MTTMNPLKLLRKMTGGELKSIFLFVTSNCNSRCRTCFYSEELNRKKDLTFDQLAEVSRSAPPFRKLWLSGGEPFLREDLAEVVTLFVRNNGVKVINLPTNGLLTDRVDDTVGKLLASCPELEIHLNFSLDGLGATHDAIRGVKEGFRKTVATMDRMTEKYGEHPRLIRNVATILTREGSKDLLELAAYLHAKQNLHAHVFETLRGNPRDPAIERLTRAELAQIHDRLMPVHEQMADRIFARIDPRGKNLAKAIFLATVRFHFDLHERNLEGPRPWGMRCTAGRSTLVIDHDGSFRACELRSKLGDLADYGFDVRAVMSSDVMENEVRAIGGGKRANCWCTHSCWILSSLLRSPRSMFIEVPRAYLRYKRQQLPAFIPPEIDVAAVEGYADR